MNSIFPSVPEELTDEILKCTNAVVCGHTSPDGDCENSVMAMGRLLEKLKKPYILVNDGPFKDPDSYNFRKYIASQIPQSWICDTTLAIAVDCGTIDRLGSYQDIISRMRTVLIDHHSNGTPFGIVNYIAENSPSTTMLIYQLFKALNVDLDPISATMIFRGLINDSGYFKFLDSNSSEVFAIVSELVKYGISPNYEYIKMTSGRPADSIRLYSKILERIEFFFDGKLVVSHEEESDSGTFSCDIPSEDFYSSALTLENVEAAVFFKISRKTGNAVEVGFRSAHKSKLNVGELAKTFGGGGHFHTGGATIKGTYEEVKKTVTDAIGKLF